MSKDINAYHCEQCGKEMNIIEWLIGHVCLACCRQNAAEVAGKYKHSRKHQWVRGNS